LEEINFVPNAQPESEENFYLTGFILNRAKINNCGVLEDENIREFNFSVPNLKMSISLKN